MCVMLCANEMWPPDIHVFDHIFPSASLRSELNHIHASAIEHLRQTHQHESAAAKAELEKTIENNRTQVLWDLLKTGWLITTAFPTTFISTATTPPRATKLCDEWASSEGWILKTLYHILSLPWPQWRLDAHSITFSCHTHPAWLMCTGEPFNLDQSHRLLIFLWIFLYFTKFLN